jgi:hypothetical protein
MAKSNKSYSNPQIEKLERIIAHYIGGQISINNYIYSEPSVQQDLKSTYCGPIESISVQEGLLEVRLAWGAKKSPRTQKWISHDCRDYTFDLNEYLIEEYPYGNICLTSGSLDQFIILSKPRNPDRLDPQEIKVISF